VVFIISAITLYLSSPSKETRHSIAAPPKSYGLPPLHSAGPFSRRRRCGHDKSTSSTAGKEKRTRYEECLQFQALVARREGQGQASWTVGEAGEDVQSPLMSVFNE
jgi:hypothetical protein